MHYLGGVCWSVECFSPDGNAPVEGAVSPGDYAKPLYATEPADESGPFWQRQCGFSGRKIGRGRRGNIASWIAGSAGAELLQISRSIGLYPETVVDGYVFPEDIHEVFAIGRQQNVPLLAGFNSREVNEFADLPRNDKTLGMADVISDYFVAFAKHGKPDPEGRPVWPAYQLDARHYMAFRNGMAIAGTNLLPGVFELYDEIVARRRSRGEVAWWLEDIGLFTPVIEAITQDCLVHLLLRRITTLTVSVSGICCSLQRRLRIKVCA